MRMIPSTVTVMSAVRMPGLLRDDSDTVSPDPRDIV
jgi:hypothetical protein